MRLQDNIDFTTLAWVKPELDETLRQAQRALEEYVEGLAEGIADPSRLRLVAGHLHQVQGTLRMVELYGAAMVAEEMEQLVIALQGEFAGSRDAGYSALMRGIMQLPDYLERLQSGHRDIPMVLLPLLNELRDARGVQRLSEAVLFSPDLSRQLPETARGPAAPVPDAPLRVQVEALRGRFQAALLQWLREDANPGNIEALTEVCERLVRITQSEDARRLFWVAAGTLEALRAGAFEASRALKQALGRVEREIKRLAEGGDAAFRNAPPLELTRQLLYFVAHAPTQHVRIDEIRDVFGLSRYLPSEAELDHARGSLAGHNRALLDTVSSALKDDLLRVKDALDLHLRAGDVAPAELEPQLEVLDRVGDTLGMLGLGVPRRVVQEQRQAIADFIGGTREANEGALLDVAGALLYVEATLDDQVARLGAAGNEETASGAEARRVLESLIKEAIANFANARQCFVAFVETNWDHEQLQDVPRLVDEVVGALRIAEIEAAPDYLVAIRRFTETELLQRRRVPNGRQMDTLADALAALEYFLEALRDQRPGRDRILDVARYSLEVLGYWPLPAHGLPATPAPTPDVPAAAPAAAAPQPPQGDAGAPAPPLAPD
ncbi:Hpt domain-containing protein, partial [Coralloluteibacterium thermophilus]